MDAHDWNARYEGSELVWSAGPNAFVVDRVGDRSPGRALDVACGEGRNALWLAEQGWDVVGVDYSDVAVDKARRIAEHRGVEVDWRVGDVTDPAVVDGTFDLVLVAYLHLPPEQMAGVLAMLAGRVAPGGALLVIGHHADNLERGYGGPPDRTVLHDPDRIREWSLADGPFDVVEADEVDRHVDTDDGERVAIDSVVLLHRPS